MCSVERIQPLYQLDGIPADLAIPAGYICLCCREVFKNQADAAQHLIYKDKHDDKGHR